MLTAWNCGPTRGCLEASCSSDPSEPSSDDASGESHVFGSRAPYNAAPRAGWTSG